MLSSQVCECRISNIWGTVRRQRNWNNQPAILYMHRGYVRPNRLNLPKPLQINFIHLLKVLHIGQEDIHFDYFCKTRSGGFEDGFQVPDALVL